jgi:hypothetical protein
LIPAAALSEQEVCGVHPAATSAGKSLDTIPRKRLHKQTAPLRILLTILFFLQAQVAAAENTGDGWLASPTATRQQSLIQLAEIR